VYAPIHQHFFNVRLDMTVDGPHNSVYEVNTVADPPGPENPHANAFRAEATLLRSESEAQRMVDPLAGRFWKIVNPSVRCPARTCARSPVPGRPSPGGPPS
jgi:primary-amine oxidase